MQYFEMKSMKDVVRIPFIDKVFLKLRRGLENKFVSLLARKKTHPLGKKGMRLGTFDDNVPYRQ